MSHSDSIRRVVKIMNRLNEGQAVSIQQMAEIYAIHPRSIRRDMALIKEIFGGFMTKQGDCYRAYPKVLLDRVLSARELMQLSAIVNLLDLTEIDSSISLNTRALIKQANEVYAYKSKPFEQLNNIEILKQLEHCIRYRKTIKLRYKPKPNANDYTVNPYKIAFLHENFYLLGMIKRENKEQFMFFRVSFIQVVIPSAKTFTHDYRVLNFIEQIQTPWTSYALPTFTIRLKVNKKVSRYFKTKHYLPSQEIVSEYPNGDLQITYKVTHFREIEDLLLNWLPRVQIIEPLELKQHMQELLTFKARGLMRKTT